jgi:hypothetical protein
MQQNLEVINVELGMSICLLAYYVSVYTLMILMCASLLPVPVSLLAISALVIHLVLEINRMGWLDATTSVNRLKLSEQGELTLFSTRDTKHFKLISSYACNWFIILTMKSPDTTYKKRIFICFDAVNNDEFRSLKILLKKPKLYLQ